VVFAGATCGGHTWSSLPSWQPRGGLWYWLLWNARKGRNAKQTLVLRSRPVRGSDSSAQAARPRRVRCAVRGAKRRWRQQVQQGRTARRLCSITTLFRGACRQRRGSPMASSRTPRTPRTPGPRLGAPFGRAVARSRPQNGGTQNPEPRTSYRYSDAGFCVDPEGVSACWPVD
jgi:hypothetical protein